MNRAIFVRNRTENHVAEQRVYRCDPPMPRGEDFDGATKEPAAFVVVSKVVVPFSGPETYIFASDADGDISDFMELPGSMRGEHTHEVVLAEAGYEVVGAEASS